MNKFIKISLISLIAIVALYSSVYFEKLNIRKERVSIRDFNPRDKAEYFWDNGLEPILQSAIDLKLFDSQLVNNPESLINRYGKAIGITSTYSFLVKSTAHQVSPNAEEIPVKIQNSHSEYSLQIKYIFGNAARDATGYFHIDDFENTMDFNAISTELNRLIVEKEIVKLDSIPIGETITFIGALEINSEIIPDKITIIPLKLEAVR